MRRRLFLPALAAALLCLAGALFWRSGDLHGASASALSLPDGGTGRIYRSGAGRDAGTLALPEDEDGHTHTVSVSGGSAAALILTRRGDGSAVLAAELARRGVTAVTMPESGDASAAWDALAARDDVRLSSLALIGGAEALDLADALADSGRECAAVILRGDGPLLERAAASKARNILFLTGAEPEKGLVTAFLGEEERKSGDIGGYFAEGTARRVIRPAPERLDREETLLPVIDWLGSSLGHAVELPDGDLPNRSGPYIRLAAGALALAGLAAAGGAVLRIRKEGTTHEE